MALTAAGVGSGLDIEGIVSQLMQLEQRPLVQLQEKSFEYRAELSAFGVLKGAVSSFQSAMSGLASLDKFKLFSSSSTASDVVSVSANSEAAKGTYDLEVQRLAQRHKFGSDTLASDNTYTGSWTFTVGSESMTVNASGSTLEELRDAINLADDNPGMTASIINISETQQKLVLTADDEGYEGRVQLTSGTMDIYVGGVDSGTDLDLDNLNLDPDNPAVVMTDLNDLKAQFLVDNVEIFTDSNSVSSVVDGVTFNLKSVGNATLNVDRDISGITGAVKKFVDAYNSLQTTINGMRAEGGPLEGDNTTLTMQSQLRSVFNSSPSGLTTSTFTSLSELGITTNAETGMLELKNADLENALTEDFNNVAELFALEDEGFAYRLEALAKTFNQSDGLLDARQDGLNNRIKLNESSVEQVEYRLEMKELALRKKFASLDALVGSMQAMSSYMANALAGLQNFNNNN